MDDGRLREVGCLYIFSEIWHSFITISALLEYPAHIVCTKFIFKLVALSLPNFLIDYGRNLIAVQPAILCQYLSDNLEIDFGFILYVLIDDFIGMEGGDNGGQGLVFLDVLIPFMLDGA